MMKLKTLTLATGFALSALSVAGAAQAGALATSVLDITGFTISQGGVALDRSQFSALLLTDTADISATLNGTTSAALGLTSPGTGIDTLAPVSVGTVTPAYINNSFAVYSSPPQGTFALADQIIVGAPISGLNQVVGARAAQAAYVVLDSVADGSSTANNGLNSSFIFALNQGGALDFTFNARAYLEAFTSAGEVFPTNASSEYSLFFTIDDLDAGGVNILTWKPDGASNAGSAGAFGLTAETDPFSLNEAISRNAPFNGASFRGAGLGVANSGLFSGTSIALVAGRSYQFTIRSTATADALAVPEPATLALLGMGLVGLGLSRRRRT